MLAKARKGANREANWTIVMAMIEAVMGCRRDSMRTEKGPDINTWNVSGIIECQVN